MKHARTKALLSLDEKHAADLRTHFDQMIMIRRKIADANGFTDHKHRYLCIEELIKDKGHTFTQVSPKLPRNMPAGTPKFCYHNAGLLSRLSAGSMHYCEGVALGMIPVHHAWLCDDQGVVYDPTWEKPGLAYVGIIFDPAFVKQVQEAPDVTNVSMIDQWEKGYPMLTGKIDIDTVRINPLEDPCNR